ncbi:hypothetical protein L3Q82_003479 [Scortum barcoo]|uniref:Uncharacterized protein n=1 Tax=Scortum barcoo TaxID=214431 RepID=A0ACB8VNJ2_9TELE|nr:hypothetical protein L3Q82_003479 [Scortum barcoo]
MEKLSRFSGSERTDIEGAEGGEQRVSLQGEEHKDQGDTGKGSRPAPLAWMVAEAVPPAPELGPLATEESPHCAVCQGLMIWARSELLPADGSRAALRAPPALNLRGEEEEEEEEEERDATAAAPCSKPASDERVKERSCQSLEDRKEENEFLHVQPRMTERKPCKVCNFTRQKSYGLVVPSLNELKVKGCEFLGFSPGDQVTVVLEDDGTIVKDESYFLCLPVNTKFMLLHEKERWSPGRRIDGGTAWMARDSMLLEADTVDTSSAVAPWWDLAQQLKQDLASIILMSEADLQALVDAPCPELAAALGFQEKKAEDLQETLQRVLDRREEERQSKELLQLYLKAVEKKDREQEGPSQPSQGGSGDTDVPDGMEVDSASGFMSRTLMVLKGKTSPETRLSTEDLQMVVSRKVEVMEQVLGWDTRRTSALLQACEAELTKRLQQIQAVQSIRSDAQLDSSQQSSEKSAEEGAKTPARGN